MNIRTTAISLGVIAALGAGTALAQQAPQAGGYGQSPGYYQQNSGRSSYNGHGRHHGVVAILKEEMAAGRLSRKEETLLVQKIKQMRSERRAEREAGYNGPPSQMQPR
ncbi:MAG TPA: hypothetical protein VGK90_10450 [Rhizomicrobium sp.]|jgi:hypothetical protein